MLYATADDLRSRWKGAASESDEDLRSMIEDASMMVKVRYPQIPEEPGGELGQVLTFVVCSMIRRASNMVGFEGFSSFSETAGQFQQNFRLANGGEHFYISDSEAQLIEGALYGSGGSAGSFEAVG